MTTKERQKAILSYLRDESTPVSATTLAKLLGVSRQIIVGDVALLRAAGTHVVATSRGYVIPSEEGSVRQVVCQHTPGQTQEELYVMVAGRDGGTPGLRRDHSTAAAFQPPRCGRVCAKNAG